MNPEDAEIKVRCNGSLIFEDFVTRLKFEMFFTGFIEEICCATNHFTDTESHELLFKASKDNSFIINTDAISLTINFHYFLPGKYLESIIEIITICTDSSICGSMLIDTGVKNYKFEKIKTDSRVEIKCTGRLFFLNYRESWKNYCRLANELMNSIFHPSYGLSPNIFIDQSHYLVLRSHCFIDEMYIAQNIIEIEKTVDSSIQGKVLLEIGDRETGFKQRHFMKKAS